MIVRRISRIIVTAAIVCGVVAASHAGETTVPSQRLKSREWLQDAKLGLFIHWGMYSLLGQDCWVMHDRKIHVKDYERLARAFNPIDFDAREWVSMAKRNGFRYITFTTRHHDGFAMFHSKASDWDIGDRTIYRKDIVEELARECRRQGIKLFLYYSHLDWYHQDYFPVGSTGHVPGRTQKGEWDKYLAYVNKQLTELLTNYGPIGGIWFDGVWDKPNADWGTTKTYELIHRLQPRTLIGNNHHKAPLPGEDFQMWERDLPGQNKAGFSHGAEVGQVPLETCDTINGAWGFNIADRNFKSPKQLIHYVVRAAGNNANLLIDVGPMPTGEIQSEYVERLDAIGAWMKKNGETVYKTRGGPVSPQEWGVTTQKEKITFVHVLDTAKLTSGTVTAEAAAEGEEPEVNYAVFLEGAPKTRSATIYGAKSKLAMEQDESGNTTITLPSKLVDDIDTIIVMKP